MEADTVADEWAAEIHARNAPAVTGPLRDLLLDESGEHNPESHISSDSAHLCYMAMEVGIAYSAKAKLKGKELDPRTTVGPGWDAARNKEHQSFKDHGVYTLIKKWELPLGSKPVPTRWVYTQKDDGTLKARLTARGDIESRRHGNQLHVDAPTASRLANRIFFHLTAQQGWDIIGWDVPTAFLQQKTDYMKEREIPLFLVPPEQLRTTPDDVWKMNKVPYGMADAPRAWYLTIRAFLLENKFAQVAGEPCAFVLYEKDCLVGHILIHVDDGIMAGTSTFLKTWRQKLADHYKIKQFKDGDFVNCGLRIRREDDGWFVSQDQYVEKLEEVKLDTKRRLNDPLLPKDLLLVQTVGGSVIWAASQTRPDLNFGASALAGEASVHKEYNAVKTAMDLIKKAKAKKQVGLRYRKLHGDLTLRVWSDAAFGNMPGSRSQHGSVTVITANLPTDQQGGSYVQGNLLGWQSHRLKRVCRSTFAAETLALVSAIDDGIYTQAVLQAWTRRSVPLELRSDCASLVEHLGKLDSNPTEKRLKIDLDAMREDVIAKRYTVKWVDTRAQYADPLTKNMDATVLLKAIDTNQWMLEYRGPNVKQYQSKTGTSVADIAHACLLSMLPQAAEYVWVYPDNEWECGYPSPPHPMDPCDTNRGVLKSLPTGMNTGVNAWELGSLRSL